MPGKRDLDPEMSPLHFFGTEVRRAREAAAMTLADLGAMVPCDASTVSRIESGQLSPAERFAKACDEAFPQMGGWFGRVLPGVAEVGRSLSAMVRGLGRRRGTRSGYPMVGTAAGAGPAPDAGIRSRCSGRGGPMMTRTRLSSRSWRG
jgi:hypothetical protein